MANAPWHIEIYKDAQGRQPVVEWLESLGVKHEARVRQTIGLLATFGLTLAEPYCRHLRGKIWELRTSVGRLEYRVLYFAATGRTFVLLHGFTKATKKTPYRAIAIAEASAADWEANRNAG